MTLTAVGAATVVLTTGAAVAGIRHTFTHQRDTSSFNLYVRIYIDGWYSSADPGRQHRDKRWALRHPGLILAEGDQACAWLAKQPTAPEVDPSGATSVDELSRSYIKETSSRRTAHVAFASEYTIVGGAWEHLCQWEREDKTAPQSLDDD